MVSISPRICFHRSSWLVPISVKALMWAAPEPSLVWVCELSGGAWKIERAGRDHAHKLGEIDVAPDFHAVSSGAPSSCISRRILRISAVIVRRRSISSTDRRPCRHMPLPSPLGAPGEAPPCILHFPERIAGPWHGMPALVRAPHRGEA